MRIDRFGEEGSLVVGLETSKNCPFLRLTASIPEFGLGKLVAAREDQVFPESARPGFDDPTLLAAA